MKAAAKVPRLAQAPALDFLESIEEVTTGNKTGAADALERVADMARLMLEKTRMIADIEEQLENMKEDYRVIEQVDFPLLLDEVGLKDVTLADGTKIELKKEFHCGISDERRPQAHAWLRDNEFDGIIKTALILEYGRGEDEKMLEDAAFIAENLGRAVDAKESIHHQTLKAWIKEQRENAQNTPEALRDPRKELPNELFGVVPYDKVKLTLPKKKR